MAFLLPLATCDFVPLSDDDAVIKSESQHDIITDFLTWCYWHSMVAFLWVEQADKEKNTPENEITTNEQWNLDEPIGSF